MTASAVDEVGGAEIRHALVWSSRGALRKFELRCAKGLGPLGAPLDEGACEQQAIQPRREDYSPGTRNGPHRLSQIRTFAFSQRDKYSLRTSKFESDMPSHGVGLRDVSRRDARVWAGLARLDPIRRSKTDQ